MAALGDRLADCSHLSQVIQFLLAMKESFANSITCPTCRSNRLSLNIKTATGEEVLEGVLTCECGHQYPISRGVVRSVASDSYVGNFSFEWQLHRKTQLDNEFSDRSRRAFREKTGVDPEDLRGKRVLDVGVGTGRFADVVARCGAETVGIDLSYAVETAWENVGSLPGTNIVQADLFALPFEQESFDFIYSIGVLHHTPDCKQAFLQLVRYLRPGGIIAIWVYDAHTWKPGSLLETSNRFWRAISTKLPSRMLYALCLLELPLYFLRKIPGFDQALHLLLPGLIYHAIPKFNDHDEIKEHVLDVFDWYSPKFQSKHTYPEVFAWFEEAGLENIRVLPNPVSVAGKMPGSGKDESDEMDVVASTEASRSL